MTLSWDDFDDWLVQMDDTLEDFEDRMPPEIESQLDFSKQSLDVVEKWLLERYASLPEILARSETDTLDQLAVYVGETFRLNIGGVWTIDLENKQNVYFRIPVLRMEEGWELCPTTMVTAAVDRRIGASWSSLLSVHLGIR